MRAATGRLKEKNFSTTSTTPYLPAFNPRGHSRTPQDGLGISRELCCVSAFCCHFCIASESGDISFVFCCRFFGFRCPIIQRVPPRTCFPRNNLRNKQYKQKRDLGLCLLRRRGLLNPRLLCQGDAPRTKWEKATILLSMR